ncbi:MAG TPA: Eco29kI family restriction endonuclease [Longimicrobium sp.]|nr:Eco29kI family restriction endonuclease [Longimicrobium sp.]
MSQLGVPEFDPEAFLQRAKELGEVIRDDAEPLPRSQRAISKQVLERIRILIDQLTKLARAIDPVHHPDVYDPSQPEAAAELIAEKLARRPLTPLGSPHQFWGSGVYALYYRGDHPAYTAISRTNVPIYVGMAETVVSDAVTARQQGDRLGKRLREHAKSIRASESHVSPMSEPDREAAGLHPIHLVDFQCRYLVLASAYAGAVESNLIRHHQPAWNKEARVCIGFGKHGDDASTRANTRSDWDTLHPGRAWATKEGNRVNRAAPAQIAERVAAYLLARYAENDHRESPGPTIPT